MTNEFKRKVVKVITRESDRTSFSSRGFSWNATQTRTAIAECGHSREYMGFGNRVPKTFSPCKDCQNGIPPNPIEGPLGNITEDQPPSVGRAIMEAIVENERAKASVSR